MSSTQNIGLTTEGMDCKSAPAGMKLQMKLNRIIFLFIFLFCLTLCFAQTKSSIKMSPPWRPVKELKKLVIEKGDTVAFYELIFALSRDELLIYALHLANKYDYADAYFWVYNSLISFYEDNKIEIDTQTLNLALMYLNKGVELNNRNCMIALGRLLLDGKYLPQDTVRGKELQMRGWGKADSVPTEAKKSEL